MGGCSSASVLICPPSFCTDAIAADMGKSAGNFVRDAVSATMVVALAPLSAILLIVR